MKEKNITRIFIGCQVFLYLFYMTADIWNKTEMGETDGIKYLSIGLCLLFLFYEARYTSKGSRIIWLKRALLLTLAADLFLLFTDIYIAGVAFFFCVQCCYRRYLDKPLLPLLWFLAALLAVVTLLTGDLLPVLAGTYFLFLLINLAGACLNRRRQFAFGLLLLMLCDICVGISNSRIAAGSVVKRLAGPGMWLFYLPSQVLITFSVKSGKHA